MRVNENTALSTAGALLVPYDPHHVPTYHAWMEDDAVRAATASERLTLDEEYENQASWRAAADKLTFIVCEPLRAEAQPDDAPAAVVRGGLDDGPDRMVGDVNLFLHPWGGEEDDGDEEGTARMYSGEVDVMIAQPAHRRRGFGRAAVTALLYYVLQHRRRDILAEAAAAAAAEEDGAGARLPQLKELVVKIQATNEASIGLFARLGFRQRGGVNYFGEVELARTDLGVPAPEGYAERRYERA